jgi:hypothetical protein
MHACAQPLAGARVETSLPGPGTCRPARRVPTHRSSAVSHGGKHDRAKRDVNREFALDAFHEIARASDGSRGVAGPAPPTARRSCAPSKTLAAIAKLGEEERAIRAGP